MNRIYADPAQQREYERIHSDSAAGDRALASLLMEIAFDGPGREAECGIGPLYLEQAYRIRRNPDYAARLQALLPRQ